VELALGLSAGELLSYWAAGSVLAVVLPGWPVLAPVQAPELAGCPTPQLLAEKTLHCQHYVNDLLA
jgi:hypothetical protein